MARPKTRDSIKGEILNGMLVENITAEEMAEALDVSRSTFYRMIKDHTDNWSIWQVRTALKKVNCSLVVEVE